MIEIYFIFALKQIKYLSQINIVVVLKIKLL